MNNAPRCLLIKYNDLWALSTDIKKLLDKSPNNSTGNGVTYLLSPSEYDKITNLLTKTKGES